MSIKIKIEPENQEPEQPSVQISLEMRKTLDGKLMILDHMHLDIVIDTKTSKITTFPKKEMSEEIYGFQRNYLEYLRKEGVIIEDSIRSGNVFGSLEAAYPPSLEPTVNATQVVSQSRSGLDQLGDHQLHFQYILELQMLEFVYLRIF